MRSLIICAFVFAAACSDVHDSKNPCVDYDGDGYSVGASCTDVGDCDDENPNVWSLCASCTDVDDDGWFVGCDAYTTLKGPDCASVDARHWSDCGACVDSDGDGYGEGCDLGPDCDDLTLTGAACHEGCDTYFSDRDHDHKGDALTAVVACGGVDGQVFDNTDCDDTSAVHWSDCGACIDADEDGYGAGCNLGPDCDDNNPYSYPGAYEVCDANDNNCNGLVDESEVVRFSDLKLEEALRAELNKPAGDILNGDFCGKTSLDLSGNEIIRLEGMQYAVAATHVYLYNNRITDLRPLSGLKGLALLYLYGNTVEDLRPLSNLKALSTLLVNSNLVTNVRPLASLENLTDLDLSYNQVTDLRTVSSLTRLTSLALIGTPITNVGLLSNLENLNVLHLSYTQITDIAPLSNLTQLTILALTRTQVADLTAIVNHPDLNLLYVENAPLSPTACNEQIPALVARGVTVQDTCP